MCVSHVYVCQSCICVSHVYVCVMHMCVSHVYVCQSCICVSHVYVSVMYVCQSCMCVMGINFASVSMIFLLDLGTVLTVCYFSIRFRNCSDGVLFFY